MKSEKNYLKSREKTKYIICFNLDVFDLALTVRGAKIA